MRVLLRAALAGHAAIDPCEVDLVVGNETRKLVINAQRLDYAGTDMPDNVGQKGIAGDGPVDLGRLLNAVLDVTAQAGTGRIEVRYAAHGKVR